MRRVAIASFVSLVLLPALAVGEPSIDLAAGLRGFRNLERYFEDGPVRRALAWAGRGKCRPALKILARALKRREVREVHRAKAAFVAGLCAHRLGQPGRAAEHLAAAVDGYPELRQHALYLLGDSLLRAGEARRAVSVLEQVSARSPHFDSARRAWARALGQSAPPDEVAARLLQHVAAHPLDPDGLPPLPPVGPPPSRQTGGVPRAPEADAPGPLTLARRAEVAWLLARALDRAGRTAQAVSQYLYVWARFPGTGPATRAADRLSELRRRVGKAAVPDVYYRFLRGRALLAAGKARPARAVLSPLARAARRRGPAELRWPIELALGVAQARSGEVSGALGTFRRVARGAPDPELRAEALYRAGELMARRRRVDRAVDFYASVAERFPESRVAARALFDGAELARLYGRHRRARALYERLVGGYARSPRAARAHWRLGWYAYREGKIDRAVRHFRLAVEAAPRGDDELRALYWLGRAEGLRGNASRQAAAYRALLREYPLTYYAYLVRTRAPDVATLEPTEEDASLGPWVGAPRVHAASEFEDERLREAREYVRLGLTQDAHRQLKRYERDRRRTPGGSMAVASLYHELGSEWRAHWMLRLRAPAFRQHLGERELLEFWRLAYPRRYTREIESAARRAKIPAALLFALVLEESTFSPRAVSPQRAIGLTQVIWETAKDMARAARVRLRSRADLFKPALNSLLGARFLATLIRVYKGRQILAVAAYNAGPGNVDRWLAARGLRRDGPVPEDEIVEDIPFEETRRYVRRVFASYAAYGYLYYGERVAARGGLPVRIAALAP